MVNMKTMLLVAMVVSGCAGRSLDVPSSRPDVSEGPAAYDVQAALDGCWTPISSSAPPTVEWVGGTGFRVDEGVIYVAWQPGEKIAATGFAAAIDAYWQAHVSKRPDLSSDHQSHCNAYLKAADL
jgi:xanthosine utilization system XapX-like protein